MINGANVAPIIIIIIIIGIIIIIIIVCTIEIEGSGAVFIDLLDDVVDVVLGQLVVQLAEDLLQSVCKCVPSYCRHG